MIPIDNNDFLKFVLFDGSFILEIILTLRILMLNAQISRIQVQFLWTLISREISPIEITLLLYWRELK